MFRRSISHQSDLLTPLVRKKSSNIHKLSFSKPYSEISSYPSNSESLKQQFKEQLGFSITSIPSQDVTEAIHLFTDNLPALSQRAACKLINLINLHIPTCKATLHVPSHSTKQVCLQLQFLPSSFPFSSTHSLTSDTSVQSSLLKRDQLTQHVAKLLQQASGLSRQLSYKHISISAVNWEHCTVFVSLSLPVLLGCLSVKGFTFSPKWNDTAYERLYKQALITTSYKHDLRKEKFNRLLDSTALSKNGISSTTSMPDCTLEIINSENYHALRSNSEPIFENNRHQFTDDELSDFSKKNLAILEENDGGTTYQNPHDGSNIAMVCMLGILGFSVRRDPMRVMESLVATLSLQEGEGLEFKLTFSQSSNAKTIRRKISHA